MKTLQTQAVSTTLDLNTNVAKYVYAFLNTVSVESDNTYNTYFVAIRDFFQETRYKPIEMLKEGDLQFSLMEVENYQSFLAKTLKASTVNTKMTAISSCMNKLQAYGLQVNTSAFNVKRLKESDSDGYDPLTVSEVREIIELVKDTALGTQKALLVEIAFVTAFRKNSILKLRWSDLTEKHGYSILTTIGKGKKKDEKKISDDLVKKLLDYKDSDESKSDELIFTMSSKTVDRMMDYIRKNIDFGTRNITFHSFKKSAIEEIGMATNYDLKQMQRLGSHADITTTLNSYLKNVDFDNSFEMDLYQEPDLSVLSGLSKEQLIQLISNVSRKSQYEIIRGVKEL